MRDLIYLQDILESAQAIQEFVEGLTYTTFITDRKTQSAIQYELMIIGEAVKNLSPELRLAHSEIPWKAIAGMRDKLIHDYGDVDYELVWITATEHLPDFLNYLKALV